MATVLKTLGQSAPLVTTLTDLYTVPASTSTVGSFVVICNRSATATSFRVSVRVAGAVASDEQYLYYDQEINGKSTFIATIGMSLATTDVVSVYATLATLSFTLFGQENN